MRSWRRGGVPGLLLEEPRRSRANERKDCGPAENIDVGPESGLLLHEAIDEAKGAGPRAAGADAVAEISGDLRGLLL